GHFAQSYWIFTGFSGMVSAFGSVGEFSRDPGRVAGRRGP
ncbi:MAG: hypothetical protein RIS35_1455, partial [Pseudomonadota bacterium]